MGEGFDELGDQFPVIEPMRFCGVPATFGDGTQQVKLPSSRITFRVDDDLPGFSRADFEAACMEAWQRWQRVIGIFVDKHANPKTDPTQVVTVRRLDRAGGVLADQQLPYGRGVNLQMRVDSSEDWVIDDSPPQGKINLLAVLCHENAHCWGAQHIPADGTPDLLNPTYSPRIFVPQPDDISYGVKLYGKADPTPEPPVVPSAAFTGSFALAAGVTGLSVSVGSAHEVAVGYSVGGVSFTAKGTAKKA